MAMTSDQMWAAIHALPWNQGKTTSPTSTPATQSTATPSLSTLTQSPTQATTNTPNYLSYNPTAGTQDFNDTWGNNYTYRDPTTPYERNLDTKVSTYAAGKDPRVQIYNLMKQYPNNNPGFNYTQEIQKLDQEMQGYKDIISRRDNNAIYKALATDPNYSYLKNKGLTQKQAAETIAGKLAGYGISNLNEIGTTPDGKFYSKLTGKEIPKKFGYTTWGDGMQKFYLQATPDGRVVPTSAWKETGMSTGGILGTLAAVGGGLAAPWAIPALGGALGVGGAVAGGLYGAGTGALSSGLSGGNIINGALTGGVTGALGGGVMDYLSSNPITTGSNAISSAGDTAADITTDILNSGATTGSNVSNTFNLGQLIQDPSSILHVGDIDTMLPGTSLASGNSGITGLTQGGSGIGLTNAASTGGAVASHVLGAGGTSALTAADGLGGLASILGGGLVGTAGGVVPAATAAAASAANFSVPEFLSNLFNTGATNFMKDPLKNSTTLLGGLISYLQGQGQSDDLAKLLKQGLSQSDPFGSQRAYYAQRLKDTYTNPVGVQKSPEYQAVHARELEALERADAAQGRRSQYGARAEKMDQNFMEYLNKERATLAGLAGSGISPSQVSDLTKTLGVGSSNAQINSTGQLLFALDQILNGK